MNPFDCHACSEYNRLSRRRFLAAGGAAAAFAALTPAWLPKVALARDHRGAQRDVLVLIFLRGGMDGLSLCVPHGEDAYYAARPVLNVPRPDSGSPNAAIDLNGFFGFHPAMAPLMPAWQDGRLLVVHAAGYVNANRSHFEAERDIEIGAGGDTLVTTGWLGRHLAAVSPLQPSAPLRGLGIRADLQQALAGGPRSLPVPQPQSFTLAGAPGTRAQREAVIAAVHGGAPEPLRSHALDSLATLALLQSVNINGYMPAGGADYGVTGMGLAMRSAAALIRAQVGVEAIAIDLGGWDTHNSQGTTTGFLAGLMGTLAGGLAAFYDDLTHGVSPPSFTVVIMSEFGRQLNENGSAGTDHGHGNAMFVLGPCVHGGRVLTNWPGLAPGQLFQGRDLEVTIDYRDILAEIVSQRLGNPNLAYVFPTFTPTPRGVFAC